MAFSVEGRAYIATYAIWSDPADDERHRDWVVRAHRRGWPRLGKGVYLGDTDFTRRADRFLSDENFRRLEEIRRAARPRRAVLLLPDRRRRRAQRRTRPPSAHSVWPVIAAGRVRGEEGDASRRRPRERACAVDRLPRPHLRRTPRPACPPRPPASRVRPGATQLTVIPSRPERPRQRARDPDQRRLARHVRRAGRGAGGSHTVSETTNTIRPKPRSAIPGDERLRQPQRRLDVDRLHAAPGRQRRARPARRGRTPPPRARARRSDRGARSTWPRRPRPRRASARSTGGLAVAVEDRDRVAGAAQRVRRSRRRSRPRRRLRPRRRHAAIHAIASDPVHLHAAIDLCIQSAAR